MTRNAAQAFAARSGNCLSLVIMTAAFAKELGPAGRRTRRCSSTTRGRAAATSTSSIGHVNLTLGTRTDRRGRHRLSRRRAAARKRRDDDRLPAAGGHAAHAHARRSARRSIVAMYMNNRAVEALAARPLRRRLLVGARGDRAGARLPRRVQHAGRRSTSGTATCRRPSACCATCSSASPQNTQAMSNLIPC